MDERLKMEGLFGVTKGLSQLLTPDGLELAGRFEMRCYEKGLGSKLIWTNKYKNLVTTVGKNYALDAILSATTLTTVGPFLGLISNVSYGAGPVAADTMASHSGWTEAGGTNAPTYTAPRKTMTFSAAAAGAKAMTSTPVYAITSGASILVKGSFIVLGTGALSTIDNTAGILFAAGAFTGGDETVSSGNTLTLTYSLSA